MWNSGSTITASSRTDKCIGAYTHLGGGIYNMRQCSRACLDDVGASDELGEK